MSKKRSIRKMPKARGIIGHFVSKARYVVVSGKVPEVSLVEARQPKKIGSCISRSDGTSGRAGDCRSVVIKNGNGGLTDVIGLGQNILVGDHARQLEIAVG